MEVILTNNSYTQELSILLNGEAVSEFSTLRSFMDEAFVYWCDKILDEIYNECNGRDFILHFASRQEEINIMEVIAKKFPHCSQFYAHRTQYAESLQARILSLNQILRQSSEANLVFYRKRILFVIPNSLLHRLEKDLSGMDVQNSFCKLEAHVISYQDYLNSQTDSDVIFIISNDDNSFSRLNLNSGFVIKLLSGQERNSFVEKQRNVFIYEPTEDLLFKTIFECLLLVPLLEIFRSCIMSLPDRIARQIGQLQSIYPKIIPVVESSVIELGRSIRIHFKTDSNDNIEIEDLRFSYANNEVIRCNGLLVEGLKEGKTELFVYRLGENNPCTSVSFNVIKRNRITELTIMDSDILIGKGDRHKIEIDYQPSDADNIDKIKWKTDNPSVATVDANGIFRGVAKGVCRIWCLAEQVSSSCRCEVRPYLQKIEPSFHEVDMIYGGSYKTINLRLFPENCIDDQIIISSIDASVANVVSNQIRPVGIGSTRIVIQNQQETVRAEIRVTVMSEKDYKRLQREKQKECDKASGKQSWFSKLFS